jgi:hypothetical protein
MQALAADSVLYGLKVEYAEIVMPNARSRCEIILHAFTVTVASAPPQNYPYYATLGQRATQCNGGLASH